MRNGFIGLVAAFTIALAAQACGGPADETIALCYQNSDCPSGCTCPAGSDAELGQCKMGEGDCFFTDPAKIDDTSCSTSLDVSGTWTEAFICASGPGNCQVVTDFALTVTQSGTDVTATGGGKTFAGKLCGTTFAWEVDNGSLLEFGFWEFSADGMSFTRTSHFRGDGIGDCVGIGALGQSVVARTTPAYCTP